MKDFNGGKPYRGSARVTGRKLQVATDGPLSDYLYFLCPDCGEIIQLLDFTVTEDKPVEYAKEHRPKAVRDFSMAFQLQCPKCKWVDFIKVANTGFQGGELPE